jgi:molybdopterin/thiamine biosynthesis adenylyltransferase
MEPAMSRLKRQSFLGPKSEPILASTTIGLVGLGGGGSHCAQQAGHIGIGGYNLVDPDHIDFGNTNRLVGGTLADVTRDEPKTAIAARIIRGLNPHARIIEVRESWHKAVDDLKKCELIIGAVDSFREREQLERFARRYLIPYIDMGMDVHELPGGGYLISGQVILSSPGQPCLRCCGLITDENLKREAEMYSAAGGRPQVVWPNGVLASTAIGLAMQIITPWHNKVPPFSYLVYDGNKGTVTQSPRTATLIGRPCPHHPDDETGDPFFDIRKHLATIAEGQSSTSQPTWWQKLLARFNAVLGRK